MPKQSAVMKIAWQIARKIIAEQTFPRLAIGHGAAYIDEAHRIRIRMDLQKEENT